MTETIQDQKMTVIPERTMLSTTLLDQILNNNIKSVSKEADGSVHRILFIVSGEVRRGTGKNKKDYLDITVSDRTGKVKMKVWERVDIIENHMKPGTIWTANVRKETYQNEPQLVHQPGDSDYVGVVSDFSDSDEVNDKRIFAHISRIYKIDKYLISNMISIIRKVSKSTPQFDGIASELFGIKKEQFYTSSPLMGVSNKDILEYSWKEFFKSEADRNRFKRFFECPASRGHHGDFLYAGITHSMLMAEMALYLKDLYNNGVCMKTLFPDSLAIEDINESIDFDMIAFAALIHDYHKIDEYTWDEVGNIDYKESSQLYHHDMRLGIDIQVIGEKLYLSSEIIDKLSHIIFTHHGQWADYKPSPKRKTYIESEIFHLLDMIESRITGKLEE